MCLLYSEKATNRFSKSLAEYFATVVSISDKLTSSHKCICKTKFLFVFRDSYGNVLPEYVTEEEHYWKNIWVGGDSRNGEMAIPSLPAIPGSYELEICCNGASMAKLDITVTE